MSRLRFGIGFVCAALAAAAPSAQAIIFDDEALEIRLNNLEERISQIEATIQQLAEKLRDGSIKDQELIDLIRQFQGSIEELGHQFEQQQQTTQSVIQDIDAAMRTEIDALSGRIDSFEQAQVLEDKDYYDQGYASYQEGSYDKAVKTFSLLIKYHSGSDLAANAQYWIGMSYLSLDRTKEAIKTLVKFVENHPQSNRAPEALLGVADAYEAAGSRTDAKKALETLVGNYPSSLAADSARQRIKSL